MSRAVLAAFLCLALLGAGVAGATYCALDDVPAATLLFPFVAFEYENPISGTTTLMHINNVGPDAQIVRLTLWSDVGVPVLAFTVVLSGYDAMSLNIRDVLFFGELPDSGTSGPLIVSGGVAEAGPVDGTPDLVDPQGTNTLQSRCRSTWPSYPDYNTIPQAFLEQIRAILQYSQIVGRAHDDCDGANPYQLDDWFEGRTTADPTWMYLTADVVWTCCQLLPGVDDATYWRDGPTENPTFDPYGAQRLAANVLRGEMFLVNNTVRYSEGLAAVHLEADPSYGDGTSAAAVRNPASGQRQTFYHRHAAPHGLSDLREPLPTAWALRYRDDGADLFTRIRLWKAPTTPPDLAADWVVTGQTVDRWNLANVYFLSEVWAQDCRAYTYYAWDDDENVVSGGVEPNLFPLVTQEVRVDQLSVPDTSGWVLFLWPPSNTDEMDLYQTWMGVQQGSFGDYSHARGAVEVDNRNCSGWLHASGFELGDTSAWSSQAP